MSPTKLLLVAAAAAAAGQLIDDSVTDRNELAQAGLPLLGVPDPTQQRAGISYLRRALQKNATPAPFGMDTKEGRMLAMWVGRWFTQKDEFADARKAIDRAATSRLPGDCAAMQRATLRLGLAAHASTADEAAAFLREGAEYAEALLAGPMDFQTPSGDPTGDDYVYCLLSSFHLENLYEADFAATARRHYDLARRAWPFLNYEADVAPRRPARDRAARIGVVSAFLHAQNSVMADFGGVLGRLPSDEFELHVVYLVEQGLPPSPALESWPAVASVEVVKMATQPLDGGVAAWLARAREHVEDLRLDAVFYPDLTMSSMAQRLAMSRLAPVQITSHGHPVTSGVATVDYYVSWAAAELGSAQDHYTETLALLPGDSMHQYNEPVLASAAAGGYESAVTGVAVPAGPRGEIFPGIAAAVGDVDTHWYVCMQKPFKLHARFGAMLAKILAADPRAALILHEPRRAQGGAVVKRDWGLDPSRVVYLPSQHHHDLMALYDAADVVLDSYYAGGCTTTREALEIGAVVVTLPAKYLGGRWSLAYYKIMGVLDAVAKDEDDYVNLAVALATDAQRRADLRTRIKDNAHKLFRQEAAVANWGKLLRDLALGEGAGADEL